MSDNPNHQVYCEWMCIKGFVFHPDDVTCMDLVQFQRPGQTVWMHEDAAPNPEHFVPCVDEDDFPITKIVRVP